MRARSLMAEREHFIQIYLKFVQVERKTKTFLSFSETQPNLSKICASRTQIARDKDHQKHI